MPTGGTDSIKPFSAFALTVTAALVMALLALTNCRHAEPQRNAERPLAQKGRLDLSAHHFSDNGTVLLDGEWQFYPRQMLYPGQFSEGAGNGTAGQPSAGKAHRYVKLPARWNSQYVNGQQMGPFGWATYRLLVKTPEGLNRLALYCGSLNTASRLYANGKMITLTGMPGTDAATSRSRWQPATAIIDGINNGRLELVLQVSNFEDKNGGATRSLIIGTAAQIKELQQDRYAIEFLLFGSLFIMGIYHLGLYFLRRKDRSPLYFGLFCLVIALRTQITGERYFSARIPEAGWNTMVTIEYLSFYVATPLFAGFVYSLYPARFSDRVFRFIMLTAAAFSTWALVMPSKLVIQSVSFYQLFTILASVYIIGLLLYCALHREEGAGLFLIGFSVLFATVVNDILYTTIYLQTGLLTPAGLFAFIFIQAVVLSRRTARAHRTAEVLTGRLELKVRIRTRELEQTNARLARAQQNMQAELEVARRIQEHLLPLDPPEIEGATVYSRYIALEHVGGDFLDYRTGSKGQTGILVADASGHGVPAALVASMSKIALDSPGEELGPQKILEGLNQKIKGRTNNNFVTACCLEFDGRKKRLTWSLAGHPPPFLLRRAEGVRSLEGRGSLLGILDHPRLEEHSLELQSGDLVLIYTDGILECRSETGELFNEERLTELLNASIALSPETILDTLLERLRVFTGEAGFEDDVTLVLLSID